MAAGLTHTHKATDRLCPFYIERNNKHNITALLATIRECRLEGFENPFGLTKVRRASQTSSSNRSNDVDGYDPKKRPIVMGNYPTQFLTDATILSSQDSDPLLRLASSGDSLFRNVPNITASQAAAATITEIQEAASSL